MKKHIFFIIAAHCFSLFGMEKNGTYNIKGLDKAVVLQALLEKAKPHNRNEVTRPDFSLENCRRVLAQSPNQYVGNIASRAIHIHFDTDAIDIRSYNINNGRGSAQSIIAELRKNQCKSKL